MTAEGEEEEEEDSLSVPEEAAHSHYPADRKRVYTSPSLGPPSSNHLSPVVSGEGDLHLAASSARCSDGVGRRLLAPSVLFPAPF